MKVIDAINEYSGVISVCILLVILIFEGVKTSVICKTYWKIYTSATSLGDIRQFTSLIASNHIGISRDYICDDLHAIRKFLDKVRKSRKR